MIRVYCILVFSSLLCVGQTVDSVDKMAKESDLYCKSTASTKPTPQLVVDKVRIATSLIEKEGTKAFIKFRGKGSPFIFAGTYLWICDLNGKLLLHPIRPDMENSSMLELKDCNNKLYITDVIALAQKNGEGWVDYSLKRTPTEEPYLRLIHFKKCLLSEIPVIVACSTDDITVQPQQKVDKPNVASR